MSTAAVPAPAGRTTPRTGGAPLGRLIRVELRKATDTRAGRWLLIGLAAICVLIAVLGGLVGERADRTFWSILQLETLPLTVFLPVVGILAATGEWSQRTALTTFALVPRRGRVVAAKIAATLVLGAVAIIAAIGMALLGALLASTAGGAPDAFSGSLRDVGQTFLVLELAVLWGVAFGLVLASPAPAIVAYFALPTAFSVVGGVVSGLDRVWDWVDPNRGFEALTTGPVEGEVWAQFGVACLLWIAIPLVIGARRTLRREVK
jgi:hypothetical protein